MKFIKVTVVRAVMDKIERHESWIKCSAITRIEKGKMPSTADRTLGGQKYDCTFVGMIGDENWIFIDDSVESILAELNNSE